MASLQKYYLNHASALLPVLHRKVLTRLKKRARIRKQQPHDLSNETRCIAPVTKLGYTYAALDGWKPSEAEQKTISWMADRFLEHRFDVLGSGWISWAYGMKPLGIEGHVYEPNLGAVAVDDSGNWLSAVVLPAHLELSKKYWQQLRAIDSKYQPIDWQRDCKSGFRWSAQSWYENMAGFHAGKPGADIKIPWELSRMHHLPRLAYAAQATPEKRTAYIREFMCQVLDFVATNPVRMGVNWAMTMDVGIRTANLLLAFDLFRAIDDTKLLSGAFEAVFAQSIYDHGHHIVRNLELKEGLAGNHYLANLTGLLFAASYLPDSTETDQWYCYALQELTFEIERQFFVDGSNFESSTAYHCLGGDLIAWSTALAIGSFQGKGEAISRYRPEGWAGAKELREIGRSPVKTKELPRMWRKRLVRVGRILRLLTKPDGTIPQIGDNDSGRLFFGTPAGSFRTVEDYKQRYANLANFSAPKGDVWDENQLNYQGVTAALFALYGDPLFQPANGSHTLEQALITSIANGNKLAFDDVEEYYLPSVNGITEVEEQGYKHHKSWTIPVAAASMEGMEATGIEGLGLYVFRAADFHLSVVTQAGEGQMYHWSHVHNDRGSFDLYADGATQVADPGAYLYGSLPEWRNRFRSNAAHATINVNNIEQNRWVPNHSVFLVLKDSECSVLKFHTRGITLRVQYRGVTHLRKIQLLDQSIEITDYCNQPFEQLRPNLEWYAAGYGKRINPPA